MDFHKHNVLPMSEVMSGYQIPCNARKTQISCVSLTLETSGNENRMSSIVESVNSWRGGELEKMVLEW